MNGDCQRWVDLSDRRALGQPLGDEEHRFLREHAQSCAECSRESASWQSLLTPPPIADLPSEGEVASIVRVAHSALREHRQRRQRWVAAGACALALAAGVALWIDRGGARPGPVASAGSAVRQEPATASQASGVAAHSEPAAPAGQTTCAEVVSGILACEGAGTVITRRELDSQQRVLELRSGRIVASLVPQPKGTSFSIATSAGRVTAVGTVFSVEITEDGATVVQVVEGKVAALATGAMRPQLVRAGETLRFGAPGPTAVTTEDRERALALLPAERRVALQRAGTTVAPRASSAEDLLEEAVALRARGEFRRAAEVYRKIHEANAGSAVGGTALVSLGELSLSSLGDAAGALAAFDAYLTTGGALSQEAAFGRARALRALNRTADERLAIEQFLVRYPDGAQSRALRQRLDAMGP
jgi:ferric-dicitrate binding protein FerR (iron transport regulator)